MQMASAQIGTYARILPPRADMRFVDSAKSLFVLAALRCSSVCALTAPRTPLRTLNPDAPPSTLAEALLCKALDLPEHARTSKTAPMRAFAPAAPLVHARTSLVAPLSPAGYGWRAAQV
jgi:hypothetical protein